LVTRAEVQAFEQRKKHLHREFLGHVRRAAKPFLVAPWHGSGSGLVCHPDNGHWGNIQFHTPQLLHSGVPNGSRPGESPRAAPQLAIRLRAGTCAPYIMEQRNGLDPLKPPPAQYVASTTIVTWDVELWYLDEDVLVPAVPFDLVTSPRHLAPSAQPHLGRDTVGAWIEGALNALVPPTQDLCDDEAARQHLLERGRRSASNYSAFRYAAALAWHMGLDDELDTILAEEARARSANSLMEINDRARWPGGWDYWSSAKFGRMLRTLPR
jgi:hypothetical protein